MRNAAHAPRRRSISEHLEPRLLFSVGDAVDPAQLGFVPVTWHGQQTYARPGEWILKLRGVDGAPAQQLGRVNRLLDGVGAGLEAAEYLGTSGTVLIKSPAAAGFHEVERAASRLPGFDFLEPNFALTIAALPNDPQFGTNGGSMWGLHNTGQIYKTGLSGGTADADIDAPEAWDISTGATGTDAVVVGVIDTGVDYNHPDVRDNIWRNPFEIPGDGIDNEGNGYIDDVYGWDFKNKDNDPYDDQGHGTHVSGTIAAEGNNGIGVVGVNWDAEIMGLKFLGSDGSGTGADAIRAVNYATDMRERGVNIRVTSNSYGGEPFSRAFYESIQASGDAGLMFVAASGNGNWLGRHINNDTTPFYPASYGHNDKSFDDPATSTVEALPSLDNVISVTASTSKDAKASFANYGAKSVDLGAPGVDILSLAHNTPVDGAGAYKYNTGTSMAAPHVAGAAALAWSVAPGASHQEIKTALLAGVDLKSSMATTTSSGGRLNAHGALSKLKGTMLAAPSGLAASISAGSNNVSLAWTDNSSDESGFLVQRSTDGGASWQELAATAANAVTYQDATTGGGTYRVHAYNATASSAFSNIASAATAPAAPVLTASAVTPTRVDLSWNNVEGATGYHLARQTTTGEYVPLTTDPLTGTSYSDTGLSPGTSYSYRIIATNGSLDSVPATDDAATPTGETPAAPSELAAAAFSTRINLTWQDNSNNEEGFRITRSDGTTTVTTKVGPNLTSYSDEGLTPATQYTYEVSAYNVGADGVEQHATSAPLAATTADRLAAPGQVTAVGVATSRIDLAWEYTDNATNPASGFKVERSVDDGGTFAEIATVAGADARSFTDTGLPPSTTYVYRVLAYNSGGDYSGYATSGSVSTKAAAVGTGAGITGQYYDTDKFTNLKMTRVDNTGNQAGRVPGSSGIAFDWGTGSPDSSIRNDTFTIRWRGQVQATHDEAYTFYTRTDESVRLWIDGKLLINIWRVNTSEWASESVQLEAGRKYDIRMDFRETTGHAVAKLWWATTDNGSVPKEFIPGRQFYTYGGTDDELLDPAPALDSQNADGTPYYEVPPSGDRGTLVASMPQRDGSPATAPPAPRFSTSPMAPSGRVADDILGITGDEDLVG